MSWGSDPPKAPDPSKVAFAQSSANISVAVSQTVLGNADEDTPEATVTYAISGAYSLIDPQYDTTGAQTGTTTRSIPRWTRSVTFKPASQVVFDQNLALRTAMNQWGTSQVTQLQVNQSAAFTLIGLPARVSAPALPSLNDGTPLPNPTIITSLPLGDLVTHLSTTRDAIDARLQYQIDIDRTALITTLANQGLFPGMEAFERALFSFDRQTVDGRIQAYLAADQAQTGIIQRELIKAQFNNDAAMQVMQLHSIKIDITNAIMLKRFELSMLLTQYADALREDALKERVLERTQPMNELSAIVHGGTVSIPQFKQFQAGAIGYTPLADSIYNSSAINRSNYQQRSQSQQQMFSSIVGFGANLIGGGAFG